MGYLWEKFAREYSEFFIKRHNMVMKSHELQEKFDEILRGDKWWEFESLSKLPIFNDRFWRNSGEIRADFGQLNCSFDVKQALKSRPFCMCSFSLTKASYWENLPRLLSDVVEHGLESYGRTLEDEKESIIPMAEKFAKESKDKDVSIAAVGLTEKLENGGGATSLSINEFKLLQRIIEDSISAVLDESLMQNDVWEDEISGDAVKIIA